MNSVTLFSQILAAITRMADGFVVPISDDWRQGRTAYGGLSAALCVECAMRSIPDLPPLRSAQFSFVGPAQGELRIVTSLLRRGKTVAFVAADVSGESGLAVRATLSFGAARSSAFAYSKLPAPQVLPPDTCDRVFNGKSPYAFAQHFDSRLAGGNRPFSGAKAAEFTKWLRHHDKDAPDSVVTLLALADVPPGAIALMSEQSPVSTVMWMADIVTDFPLGDDGWRLVDCRADTVLEGYSSELLNIWSRVGNPLLISRQYVAVFA